MLLETKEISWEDFYGNIISIIFFLLKAWRCKIMSTQPLLSIVIANYNYGRFLEEAIQSVLSQSCND